MGLKLHPKNIPPKGGGVIPLSFVKSVANLYRMQPSSTIVVATGLLACSLYY